MQRHVRSIAQAVLATATLCLASQAMATPVSFSVQADSFTPGSGYGPGLDDLGVTFTPTGATNNFSLNVGGSNTFKFGDVRLQDEGLASLLPVGAFINPLETNGLGVSANFTFFNPLTGTQTVTATGTAIIGFIADPAVDFRIDWNDVLVGFGNGGQFQISMNDLAFSANNTTLQQNATITLLTNSVPEPASIALVGIALLGLGMSARSKKAAA